MSPPVRPQVDPAALWDWLRHQGLSEADATTHVQRYLKGATPETPSGPTAGQAVLRNAAQAATSGLADELVGAMESASGRQPYAQARDITRKQISEARTAHPVASLAGTVAGGFANPLSYLLRPLTAGLGPKMTGAIYGGTLGAAQGAGEAPEGSRGVGAAVGAAAGIPLGLLGGYAAQKLGPSVRQLATNLRGGTASVPLKFDLLPPEPTPPVSVTNTPPILSRPNVFPSGGLLDQPTFQRQAVSPLEQTAAEQGATAGAKALRARAREAARTAYNLAIAAGQSPEMAKAAAVRAAGMAAGPPGLLAP